MNADTRQTLIGVAGLTAVMIVALLEDFNGSVTMAYFLSVVGLISPEVVDRLPFGPGGAG